jgi:hypothetical protein
LTPTTPAVPDDPGRQEAPDEPVPTGNPKTGAAAGGTGLVALLGILALRQSLKTR